MPIRLLSGDQVDRLLPMPQCIALMEEALAMLARGEAILPLRMVMRLPGKGAFGLMPSALGAPLQTIGLKAITVFPANHGTGLDSHQGVVLVFEPDHGSLVGILDASRITALRTAAVSAVATRLLAAETADTLGLIGSGVQARTHLAAMHAVRPLRSVKVYSPSESRRRGFVDWASEAFSCSVEGVASAREAVWGSDIICTITSSSTPVLEDSWVAPGTHINAVGASLKEARELPSALVARAKLWVDRRESAEHEAGDYLIPLQEGAIGPDHIAGEIGELLTDQGAHPEPRAPEDVTVFKSLGLAIQDAAVGRFLVEEGARQGVGTVVNLGGEVSS